MTEPLSYGQHMKRILRHTLVYGLGFAGTSALMLLLTPLYTHFIAPEGYGRLRLVNVSIEVLAIVGRMGVIEAFYRFFYQFSGEAKKGAIVSTCLLLLVVPLVIIGILVALLAQPLAVWILDSPADAQLFQIAAGVLVAAGISTFGLAYLRVEEKSGWYAGATVLQLAAALGLNILFVAHMKLGVAGVLLASLISQSALALLLMPWVLRAATARVDLAAVKSVLRFGVPLVPATVAAYLITNSSLYFLKHYGELSDVGVYSLALQFGSAINLLLVTPFDMTWSPMKYKLVDDPQADRIYSNVLTYFVTLALFAVVGLSVLIGDLMALIIDDRYRGAAMFVGGIGLSYAVFGAYRVFCFGMDIRNKTYLRAIIIVVSLGINLLVNASAVPTLGAWGAIAALLSAYGFMAIAAYVISQRLFPVSYQLGRIGKASVAAGLHFAAAMWVDTGLPLVNLVAKTVIVAGYPLTLYVFRFYTAEERAKVAALFARLRGTKERDS